MPLLKIRTYLINSGSFTGSFSGTGSYARNALTASYALNASGGGGGVTVQTGSISKQTIWNNVVSGSQLTINNLNLSGNKWDVRVIEEWDAKIITGGTFTTSSLLLHFNGTNNSTTFTDSSPNNLTVTSNNGAKITSSISKFGNASLFLDGTDDYVTVVDSSKLDFGSGDFTIEYWEYRINNTNSSPTLARNTNSFTPYFIWHGGSSTIELYLSSNGSSWDVASAVSMGTIITNAWTHYAVTRNGNTFRTFQNGTQISSFTSAATLPAGSGELQIGRYTTSFYFKGGYIDELRITKGVARYTSNFTTSSVQFPNNNYVSQSLTRYVGTVGGLNDRTADYGVQKLSDTSLKVVKMTTPSAPYPSGSLSASINRVYVNVLDYNKVSVTSSYATNALTASYSLNLRNINISGSNLGIGTSKPISLLQVSSSFNDTRIDNGSGNASIRIYGYNQGGGSGFHQFLEVKHTLSSATNPYKFFRLTNVGTIEIINSAYTAAILSLTNAGVLSTPGGGTSDKRVKNNIQPITENTLPIIEKLEPVKFQFKSNPNITRHGFVAQDVLNIKPDLVLGDGDQEGGTYGLDYDGLLALTIKALQEANIKIKQLEQRIIQLENK